MSPLDSTDPGGGSLLSRINVYTVMLGVALLALVIGCVLLAMELGRYKWDTQAKTAPRVSSLETAGRPQIAAIDPHKLRGA